MNTFERRVTWQPESNLLYHNPTAYYGYATKQTPTHLEFFCAIDCCIERRCPDASSKTEIRIIGDRNGLLDCIEADEDSNGAEDFFSSNGHGVLHVSKDSGLNVVSLGADALSTTHKTRTLGFTGFDVPAWSRGYVFCQLVMICCGCEG